VIEPCGIAAPPFGWAQAAAEATQTATAAAERSHVSIRELDQLTALEGVSRLLSAIWKVEPSSLGLTIDLLRGLSMTGNYVAGAYRGDELVGAAVAFFGARHTIHSNLTGAVSAAGVRNVGFALKLHQRAWALRRGIATITWTFDPLIRRNAYFNLTKLGANAVEYLPNFYGELDDPINAGDETDRLLVRWDLLEPATMKARPDSLAGSGNCERTPSCILRVGDDGAPRRCPWTRTTALLQVPADVESMRVADPSLARAWRLALRDALGQAMAEGAKVTGFRRIDGYLIEPAVPK
jgi:predicted GNAT superfamily acetyltransferase